MRTAQAGNMRTLWCGAIDEGNEDAQWWAAESSDDLLVLWCQGFKEFRLFHMHDV